MKKSLWRWSIMAQDYDEDMQERGFRTLIDEGISYSLTVTLDEAADKMKKLSGC